MTGIYSYRARQSPTEPCSRLRSDSGFLKGFLCATTPILGILKAWDGLIGKGGRWNHLAGCPARSSPVARAVSKRGYLRVRCSTLPRGPHTAYSTILYCTVRLQYPVRYDRRWSAGEISHLNFNLAALSRCRLGEMRSATVLTNGSCWCFPT